MKVILSRKGFDSQYGRQPSPILPDGRMISLPIPDKASPLTYGEIQRDGITIGDIARDLTRGKTPHHHKAHLDPDLEHGSVNRPQGWRPIFGQSGAATTHIKNQGVVAGDLFLFFGWFRRAHLQSGKWSFVPGTTGAHVLWGWMLIRDVFPCGAVPADVARWGAGHPHLCGPPVLGDSVFVGADELVLGERRLPGTGLFSSRPNRVLTMPGASRTQWLVPAWMHPDAGVATLSYHGDPGRWGDPVGGKCTLSSVAKGQEFVLSSSRGDLVETWLEGLFDDVQSLGSC